jgi:hypothetical protein
MISFPVHTLMADIEEAKLDSAMTELCSTICVCGQTCAGLTADILKCLSLNALSGVQLITASPIETK